MERRQKLKGVAGEESLIAAGRVHSAGMGVFGPGQVILTPEVMEIGFSESESWTILAWKVGKRAAHLGNVG